MYTNPNNLVYNATIARCWVIFQAVIGENFIESGENFIEW
jgi:hypothetical protein